MRSLSCNNRIYHNTEITAGRIFHSGRDIHTADSQTVLLILYAAGADCHIGQNIGYIAPVFGIEHFIGCGKSRLRKYAHMYFAYCYDAFEYIGLCIGVGLV